jgi:hypothetical protein
VNVDFKKISQAAQEAQFKCFSGFDIDSTPVVIITAPMSQCVQNGEK